MERAGVFIVGAELSLAPGFQQQYPVVIPLAVCAKCRRFAQAGFGKRRTGDYWNNHEPGVYLCAACGLELFGSDTKFDSGTGWPSFYQPINDGRVGSEEDNSLFSRRTEVHCARCDGRLVHVFEEGPKPTGPRYGINSAALKFGRKQ